MDAGGIGMSEIQYLTVGYALFMVLIGGELLWSWMRADGGYRLSDFVVNIGHGAVFQVFDGFTKFLVLAPFLLVGQYAVFVLPMESVWGWFLGLLIYDFAGYWQHRHHHRIHALWAIHGVHHAAEDFNFGAALRQALFGNLTAWLWKAPLALVMPMKMFIGLVVFDYIYQFVQHTRYVPKLGPLEWVFNTPSHHRVHHGRQSAYLDKNYGGILIIWDRFFGTFEEEQEEPDYGITMPLNTLNPVWGNLALWDDLISASRRTTGWRNKLKLWFGPPEWIETLAAPLERRIPKPLENREVPQGRLLYVGLSYMGLPLLLGSLPWIASEAWELRLAMGFLAILAALTPGALLEEKAWARPAEQARLLLMTGLLAGVVVLGLSPVAAGALLLALASTGLAALVAYAQGLLGIRVGMRQ